MKKTLSFTTILLSAMILMQSASLLVVDAGFNANHSYIAKVLCVNRAKPQLHCDGKCFLKKELATQQEKDSSHQRVHPNATVIFFCDEASSYHYYHSDQRFFLPQENYFYSYGFITTNERPPTC